MRETGIDSVESLVEEVGDGLVGVGENGVEEVLRCQLRGAKNRWVRVMGLG